MKRTLSTLWFLSEGMMFGFAKSGQILWHIRKNTSIHQEQKQEKGNSYF